MKYDRLSETAPGAIIHICTGEHLVRGEIQIIPESACKSSASKN
jgi:hypothetical protein